MCMRKYKGYFLAPYLSITYALFILSHTHNYFRVRMVLQRLVRSGDPVSRSFYAKGV